MTRETKIGLLVGLAFIIVIGILLSDHMTSTTQPPQAALVETARNVGASVTSPAPTNPAPAPVGNVPPITPANPVLTQVELQPPAAQAQGQSSIPAPMNQIVVGGPAVVPQQQQPIAIRQSEPTAVVQQQQPRDATTALEQWAQDRTNAGVAQPPAQPTPTAKREYVAQAGDNLSKLATKMLGANNKANRDAIVKANPSLQKDPNLIVEGKKYTIPQVVAAAAPLAPAPTPAVVPAPAGNLPQIPETVAVNRSPVPVTDLVDPLPASSPASGGGTWYVVKENDNLWKIANEQLGSGNAWQQIRELNKDVLKGGETVLPNMRLRLPAKSVASAN